MVATIISINCRVFLILRFFSDLALNFGRWDLGGNGKVRYGDLPGYLGPETPSEELLQKFDANHDNLYSLKELAAAFGYNFGNDF